MIEQVSIIGCGWLGVPLGKELCHAGFRVMGTTTKLERFAVLKANGIEPFLFSLGEAVQDSRDELWEADVAIVSIPPRLAKQGDVGYLEQMKHLYRKLEMSRIKRLIFISTTSVYPDLNRVVEEAAVMQAGQSAQPVLVEAEELMAGLRIAGKNVTILRLAGLMGYDRIPGKYVSGKKGITTGDISVNYIHRDDVIEAIKVLIANGCPDDTYNLCAPEHPARREVYDASCRQFGWELPSYEQPTDGEDFKIISAQKFVEQFSFSFNYPDPVSFFYQLS